MASHGCELPVAVGAATGTSGEDTPIWSNVGTVASVLMSDDGAALRVSTVEELVGLALSRTMTSAPSRAMATTMRPRAR